MSEYYRAYEERYRRVYAAGGDYWGHTPEDEALNRVLAQYVERFDLRGRSVLECMCGEGAAGVVLSGLGCRYTGVDIAPSAVERARRSLEGREHARVLCADVTSLALDGQFDAALDVMGIHMLITDAQRADYLRSLHDALRPGAPLLMYHESYRREVYSGPVDSVEQWRELTGVPVDVEDERPVNTPQGPRMVFIRRLLARAQDRSGYERELNAAGFDVIEFAEDDVNSQISYSATILARRR